MMQRTAVSCRRCGGHSGTLPGWTEAHRIALLHERRGADVQSGLTRFRKGKTQKTIHLFSPLRFAGEVPS